MILCGLGKKTFTKLLKFSKRVFRTPEKTYFKIRKGLFFHLPRKIIKNLSLRLCGEKIFILNSYRYFKGASHFVASKNI
jgi:hypothetical protein